MARLPRPRRPRGRTAAAALVVVLVLLSGAACDDDGSAGPEAGPTVRDVTSDPISLEGEEVAISGVVGEVYGPNGFALEDGQGEHALVIGEDLPEVIEDDPVRVIGRVEALPPESAGEGIADVLARMAGVIDEEGFAHAVVASQIEILEEPVGYSFSR